MYKVYREARVSRNEKIASSRGEIGKVLSSFRDPTIFGFSECTSNRMCSRVFPSCVGACGCATCAISCARCKLSRALGVTAVNHDCRNVSKNVSLVSRNDEGLHELSSQREICMLRVRRKYPVRLRGITETARARTSGRERETSIEERKQRAWPGGS